MEDNKTLNLTVVIPTFERKEALLRLLKSFLNVNYLLIDELIISDNHSSYDIVNYLRQELPEKLYEKIRFVINKHNIGGQGNINNSFLLAKTKWMWLIGDDDVITDNSLEIIAKDISEDPDCAWFKYSTANIGALEDNCSMYSLGDFIDYYEGQKRVLGNLVFMSNNIYNMQLLSPFIIYAFDYSYTFASQILPPLIGLDRKAIHVKFRSDSICDYSIPTNEEQWNCLKVFLGVSTIENIPFKSLTPQKVNLLKKQFVFWSFGAFSKWVDFNWNNVDNKHQIIKVCKNLYSPYMNWKERILYVLLWLRIETNMNMFSYLVKYKYGKIAQ